MKIHNRSPTIKEVRKSEQCRHTFRITVAKCAPCDGYNLNCEHYEKTNKGAADKTSFEVNKPPCAASAGRLFYMWCGAVGCATDHRKRGRTPSAPDLLEIMEAGLHRQARSVKPYLHDNDGG